MSRKFSLSDAAETLSRPDAPFESAVDGGRVTFPNGWTVGIRWSSHHYCENRDLDGPLSDWRAPAPDSSTAEVAIWKGFHGDLETWPDGDTVCGYVTWDQVQRLLDLCERDQILKPDPAERRVIAADWVAA